MSFGVEGVSKDFGEIRALRGVDLVVPSGSVVAIVGGDGAGKTTLLRCLVGRIAPSAGHVRRPAHHDIGYMPSTSGTWRELTVNENIDFVAAAFSMSPSHRDRRRDDLLGRAGLAEASERLARNLSGGMRQKLGFVLAMLHEPQLLVLDEPSTGVDPVSRVELWRLVAEAAASGTAVAMATTYLDEAERASLVTILDRGRTIASGAATTSRTRCPATSPRPSDRRDPERSWRRRRSIREWHPDTDGTPSPDPDPTDPDPTNPDLRLSPADLDFEDVVIAQLLYHRDRDRLDSTGAS